MKVLGILFIFGPEYFRLFMQRIAKQGSARGKLPRLLTYIDEPNSMLLKIFHNLALDVSFNKSTILFNLLQSSISFSRSRSFTKNIAVQSTHILYHMPELSELEIT